LCIIRKRTSLTIIKKKWIDIREGWAYINNFYCSHKRKESWTKVGKLGFCRNTTMHFLNFEIYKRSLYHEGRELCKQVINHGSRTVFRTILWQCPIKRTPPPICHLVTHCSSVC
jgi:hypothetical protein